MNLRLEERISSGIARWVAAVIRHAPVICAAMFLATLGIGTYAASHLGMKGDTDSLFSPELPFRQHERLYHDAFPMLYENMFVVIDAVTPERAGEAVAALAERLRAQPDDFHVVHLPGGGAFFDRHAFLYLETEELEDLADSLAEAQPYLAELSRDGSLRGLSDIMVAGARAVRDDALSGTPAAMQLGKMFDRFAIALDARLESKPFALSWSEVIASSDLREDTGRRFLIVQPVLRFGELQPAKRSIEELRRIAGELGLDASSGVRVRITGDVALTYEEMESVRSQAALAGIASFVLVGFILALGLRSLRLVLAILVTLIVGLVWTAGFTAVAIGHFNMISVTFAVLFIGLGVDFGIHLCTRYRELMATGVAHAEALDVTARDVGTSVALCATTTAIGFFAFVPTSFLGVGELGLISGAGMFVSLFCSLTLLPALLTLRPIPFGVRALRGGPWSGRGLAALPTSRPRPVRIAALVLGGIAIFLLPYARFDNNPLNVRDPSTESVKTFSELLESGGTSPWTLGGVAPDLATASEIADRIRSLDVVERVVTVADYVPRNQQEKLGIIGDVAMFLAPPPGPEAVAPPPSTAEQVESLRGLREAAASMLASGADGPLASSARDLEARLGRYLGFVDAVADPDAEIQDLERSLVASLPAQLRTLNAALTAGAVTQESLPGTLLERMISADGQVRIEIFPRYDLNDRANLVAFVDGVREELPRVSGSAAEVLESGRAVVRSLSQAMISAVVVITLLLLVLWRRVDDAALVLVPLGLAATLTVAAAVLVDIPFNFADVIVLPLLLGIGVDSGIHLVQRARSGGAAANLLTTGTARAVVFSALTTIASFGTLGFSTHMGMATLGRLLTLGVGFTILCNLLVLPALLPLRERRSRLVTRHLEA